MATVNQPITAHFCETMIDHYDLRSQYKDLPFAVKYYCIEQKRYYQRLLNEILSRQQQTLFFNH